MSKSDWSLRFGMQLRRLDLIATTSAGVRIGLEQYEALGDIKPENAASVFVVIAREHRPRLGLGDD